jgi:regulator of RNase E activity RraA
LTVEARLADETRDHLMHVSTATITTRLFARGLRNTYLSGLGPLREYGRNMVGEAFTLRYVPAREDVDVLAVFADYDHPQRRAIEQAPVGSVLVMDCRGADSAASGGEILMTRLHRRGIAGMVTDGSLRDSKGIETLDMPIYVKSRSPMTNLALHHAVDLNVPVGCGGVAVYPGDIIVGDGDGAVCLPRELAVEVAEEAHAQEAEERFILHKVQAGSELRGTYPPDENTKREYRASLESVE